MTDAEIKRALECCSKDEINGLNIFTYGSVPMRSLLRYALDLINRYEEQIATQQAEIDEYKALYEGLKAEHIETIKAIKHYKAEAYKECIAEVKKEINEALKSNYRAMAEKEQTIPIYTETEFLSYCGGKIDCLRGLGDFLDNLLKELVGE